MSEPSKPTLSTAEAAARCDRCHWFVDLGEPAVAWGRCKMTTRQLRLRDDRCGQYQEQAR